MTLENVTDSYSTTSLIMFLFLSRMPYTFITFQTHLRAEYATEASKE